VYRQCVLLARPPTIPLSLAVERARLAERARRRSSTPPPTEAVKPSRTAVPVTHRLAVRFVICRRCRRGSAGARVHRLLSGCPMGTPPPHISSGAWRRCGARPAARRAAAVTIHAISMMHTLGNRQNRTGRCRWSAQRRWRRASQTFRCRCSCRSSCCRCYRWLRWCTRSAS
jgi:hypothetical protein